MSKTHALGQNFLIVPQTIQTIVDSFLSGIQKLPVPPKQWIEVGPGEGALSFCVAERLKKFAPLPERITVFERDRDLVTYWESQSQILTQKFGSLPQPIQWSVSAGDFVQTPIENHLPACVLSNLPYSAATAILLKLNEHVQHIPWMVLMFQKEVGLRLLAEPSTPDRGSLTLWIQNRWQVSRVLDVPPSHFRPAPKVDSIVLSFKARPSFLFEGTNPGSTEARLLDRLLRVSFSQRRKMLRGVLGREAWGKMALESAGVDGTKRAEALVLEEWLALFKALRGQGDQK